MKASLYQRTLSLFLLGLLALAPFARSVDIVLIYDDGDSDEPGEDPNGAKLSAIMQAAAVYWEDIIKGPQVLTITYHYDSSSPSNGQFYSSVENNGFVTSGKIRFRPNPTLGWWWDPTPFDNSEYDLQETLVRDMAPAARDAMFAPGAPRLFEALYWGVPAEGAPADAVNKRDMFTYALHEMGHALGMTGNLSTTAAEIADNDYDLDPLLLNGANASTLLDPGGGAHVECNGCLMNTNIGPSLRKLPSAADVLSIATCPDIDGVLNTNQGWLVIDLPRKEFLPGGSLNWNIAGNWVGARLPDADDRANIRLSSEMVGDHSVFLSGNGVCRELFLSGSTGLSTGNNRLDIAEAGFLVHDGTLPVPRALIPPGGEIEADKLTVSGAEVFVAGGLLDLNGNLILDPETEGETSTLSGYGTVTMDGGKLTNNGLIETKNGNTLRFVSGEGAPWDLDGSQGNGQVKVTFGDLHFDSGAVSDAFDGDLLVQAPYELRIDEPWSLGPGAVVDLVGTNTQFAEITGAFLQAADGFLDVTGRGRITPPVQYQSGFICDINADSRLDLTGLTTIEGGDFDLEGNGSTLFLTNITKISGGSFDIAEGALLSAINKVTLSGGTFTGNGVLSLTGADTIVANDVTINTATVKLDGFNDPAKKLILEDGLVINSQSLDIGNNSFDSVLEFVGKTSRFTVNTPDPWTMAGTMTYDAVGPLDSTCIAGSPMVLTGSATLKNHPRWNTHTTIHGPVALLEESTSLYLTGSGSTLHRIEGGSIGGQGLLKLQTGSGLSGFGSVSSDLRLPSNSSFLADGGTLQFSGAFETFDGTVGTLDAASLLRITNPWVIPSTASLSMNDGTVEGAHVVNTNLIEGFGTIRNEVHNNGTISANGGTLTIDTANGASSLDGFGTDAEIANHQLNAINGNITVVKAMADNFAGHATVGEGRTMSFLAGWTLAELGQLDLSGGAPDSPATLSGSNSVLRGQTRVDGSSRIATATSFESTSTTNLFDNEATLELLNPNNTYASGATMNGSGSLEIAESGRLSIAPGASIGTPVSNHGVLSIGPGFGTSTVAAYAQSSTGTLHLQIHGKPNGASVDQLEVAQDAELGGTLSIDFNIAAPIAGAVWQVVGAQTISGNFSKLAVTGLPAGFGMVHFTNKDGAFIKLTRSISYGKWAVEQGLTALNDDLDSDPDGDEVSNGLEMFLGTNPLKYEANLLPQGVVEVGGEFFLSINATLSAEHESSDLTLRGTRSTDLINWDETNVIVEVVGFDEGKCVQLIRVRSDIPLGTIPREFLRLEVE